MNLNHIIISCRLTRDCETRDYNGKTIMSVGLVHNESRKVKGEWESEATFLTGTLFDAREDQIEKAVKGAECICEGKLKQENYKAKDGSERTGYKLILSKIHWLAREKESKKSVIIDDPAEEFEMIEDNEYVKDGIPF